MIRIEHCSKSFNTGTAAEVQALKDVSLTIGKGEFVIFLGSNGSGKSTLLNMIAGTLFPDSGAIFIDEKNVTRNPEHKRSKLVSRVFQNPLAGTAPDLTILDNFRLAAIRTQSKTLRIGTNSTFRSLVKERIATLNLQLENKLDQLMGTLSGGQRQALTLLMSVMDDSRVLLLDEPTAALDPRTSELIMKLADNIISKYNLTAILVTHNLKDAVMYGNRVIQMNEGKIEKDVIKNKDQILSFQAVSEWFS